MRMPATRQVACRVFDLGWMGNGRSSCDFEAFTSLLSQQRAPVLGLDVGTRHIGTALSDEGHHVAFPHIGFQRGSIHDDIDRINAITSASGICIAIVGMPATPVGIPQTFRKPQYASGKQPLQTFIREYSTRVLEQCGVEALAFWDESFSTVVAKDQFMKTAKKSERNDIGMRKRASDTVS